MGGALSAGRPQRPARPLSPRRAADDPYARIYAVVARIPEGKVATYGQVAALAGLAGHARQVGYALRHLPDGSELPWQRVINQKGEVSPRSAGGWERYQQHLLEEEGVRFDARGRVDLESSRWEPDDDRPTSRSGRRRPKGG